MMNFITTFKIKTVEVKHVSKTNEIVKYFIRFFIVEFKVKLKKKVTPVIDWVKDKQFHRGVSLLKISKINNILKYHSDVKSKGENK